MHLGIAVAVTGGFSLEMAGEWLVKDLIFRVVVGAVAGAAVGSRRCGRISPGRRPRRVWH